MHDDKEGEEDGDGVMMVIMLTMCVCVRYGRAPNQPEAVAELSSAVHPVPPSLCVLLLGPGDGGRGGALSY